jgi:rod shape-determining protein MreD
MVRAALASKHKIGQGPRPTASYIPAASVVVGWLLAALPIVTASGWYPDFGFLALIGWRLLRADPGLPVGGPAWPCQRSHHRVAIGFRCIVDRNDDLPRLIDRRTMWRDYWIEWPRGDAAAPQRERRALAAGVMGTFPFSKVVPALLISIFAFPIAAWSPGSTAGDSVDEHSETVHFGSPIADVFRRMLLLAAAKWRSVQC